MNNKPKPVTGYATATSEALELSEGIPTHSKRLWVLLIISLSLILLATIYKDWWLTGEQPNVLFYLLVPLVDILSTSLAMYLAAKIFKESITFLQVLAISLGAVSLLQIMEIIEKLIWYKVWQYPGMLYLGVNFRLYFVLVTYGLARWTGARWWVSLAMAFFGLVGSLIVGGIFLSFTGISTPGS